MTAQSRRRRPFRRRTADQRRSGRLRQPRSRGSSSVRNDGTTRSAPKPVRSSACSPSPMPMTASPAERPATTAAGLQVKMAVSAGRTARPRHAASSRSGAGSARNDSERMTSASTRTSMSAASPVSSSTVDVLALAEIAAHLSPALWAASRKRRAPGDSATPRSRACSPAVAPFRRAKPFAVSTSGESSVHPSGMSDPAAPEESVDAFESRASIDIDHSRPRGRKG